MVARGAGQLVLALVLTGLPSSAMAQDDIAALARQLDIVWILVAATLVLLMQAGFMFLEAGMVRSKNSVNVAQKNFLDLVTAIVVFALVGFMLAFGTSWGAIGWDARLFGLADLTSWELAFFAFQVMFCGTAATIVSGAVAERLRLLSYVIASVIVAGLIYPVFVHWAWGNALGAKTGAWLANLGFVDFAGSTVVHSTGAWVALAACLVIGPRVGKFGADGKPLRMAGHSAVLTTAGAFMLFFGWLGFNGGSTAAATPAIGGIMANTILAAGAGGFAGYLIGLATDRIALPEKPINGMLGGLVAITASCHIVGPSDALVIGALGAAAALGGNWLLEHRLRIDDAVGAIGVHGFAGVLGTIALAFLADPALLPHGDPWRQAGVQLLGSGINFVWAFGLGLVTFTALAASWEIRPTIRDERRGLNEAEHDTRIGVGHVENALGALISGTAGLDLRLPVERGDDAENLTQLFNQFMVHIERGEARKGTAREIARAREEAERLSAMADATFEGICVTVDGIVRDGNRALEKLVERPLGQMRGMPLATLLSESEQARVSEALARDDGHPFETAILDVRGDAVPVEIRTRQVAYHGRMTRVFAISDLRERKVAEERIRFLAQHDPLTGLPNRAVFNALLTDSCTRVMRSGKLSALLLVDLDRFKDINDVHGHPAGDAVLRETAARLRGLLDRREGAISRLGGDEYAVILDDIHFLAQATDLALSIVEQLSRPIAISDKVQVRVGASVGVSLLPRDGVEPEQVFARADLALYAAKTSGRNTYAVFEPGMDDAVQKRRMLEADLETAIANGEMALHLQPRYDLATRMATSYEGLLRWTHPTRGPVSPGEFIAIAELSGQIVDIGTWVIREACRIGLADLGDAKISVNVSPVQFRDRNFIEKLLAILEETGFPAGRLELELTESVLIEDEARATAIFRHLKDAGIRIALDDFGTGYSSLSYLQRFPFDCIKIDRSFVRNLAEDRNTRAIAASVIGLGKSLQLDIVAEGVERMEELRLLQDGGCDEVQGYLTGAPMPVEALELHHERMRSFAWPVRNTGLVEAPGSAISA